MIRTKMIFEGHKEEVVGIEKNEKEALSSQMWN
jgi:hypothetical protein